MGLYKRAFIKRAKRFFDDFADNPGATAAGAATGAALGFGGSRLAGANKGTTAILTLLGMLGGGYGGGKLGAYITERNKPTIGKRIGGAVEDLYNRVATQQNIDKAKGVANQVWNRASTGKSLLTPEEMQKSLGLLQTWTNASLLSMQQARQLIEGVKNGTITSYNQLKQLGDAAIQTGQTIYDAGKATGEGLADSFKTSYQTQIAPDVKKIQGTL